MKMKRLCALAVLLTSSLASAAGDVVANLEGQYYAGLNFGAGWGSDFIMLALFLVTIMIKTLNLNLRFSATLTILLVKTG